MLIYCVSGYEKVNRSDPRKLLLRLLHNDLGAWSGSQCKSTIKFTTWVEGLTGARDPPGDTKLDVTGWILYSFISHRLHPRLNSMGTTLSRQRSATSPTVTRVWGAGLSYLYSVLAGSKGTLAGGVCLSSPQLELSLVLKEYVNT